MTQFDGSTYSPDLDKNRLKSQLERVKALMLDGNWYLLMDIVDVVGGSTASVSARIRDLRKVRYGAYEVERRRISAGSWAYRLVN